MTKKETPIRTKEEVRAALNLDHTPDDEFMRLLEDVGDEPIVRGPKVAGEGYTPERITDELTEAIVALTVGGLLSEARRASNLSLRDVAQAAGVSRARVHELESSENVETASILRIAGAMGYHVRLTLVPDREGLKPLSADLPPLIA